MQTDLTTFDLALLKYLVDCGAQSKGDLIDRFLAEGEQAPKLKGSLERLIENGWVEVDKKARVFPLGSRYYTPKWCVDLCVEHILPKVVHSYPRRILEPGTGKGVFVRAMRQKYKSAYILGVDNDPLLKKPPECDDWFASDFTEVDFSLKYAEDKPFDLAIGNPPFPQAQKFIENSLRVSSVVIFLLRIGFLASASRQEFFEDMPPTRVDVLPNRPGFTVKGTDSYDYAFMSWDTSRKSGGTMLDWLPVVEKAVRKGNG